MKVLQTSVRMMAMAVVFLLLAGAGSWAGEQQGWTVGRVASGLSETLAKTAAPATHEENGACMYFMGCMDALVAASATVVVEEKDPLQYAAVDIQKLPTRTRTMEDFLRFSARFPFLCDQPAGRFIHAFFLCEYGTGELAQARGENTLGRLAMDAGIAEAKEPSPNSPFAQWVSRFDQIWNKASLLERRLLLSARVGLASDHLK